MRKTKIEKHQSSLFEVVLKKDKCKGCKLCVFYCPVKHLKMSGELNKRGVEFARVHAKNKCIGCGFCFFMCPDSCIEIYEK